MLKTINKSLFKSNNKGSLYLELLLTISILIIGNICLLPFIPNALKQAQKSKIQTNLLNIAESAGNYIFAWVSSPLKTKPLWQYSDGEQINEEMKAKILLKHLLTGAHPNDLEDKYKVSFNLFESMTYKTGAIFKATIWYDTNNNNIVDQAEPIFKFTTFIAERPK